MRELKFRAWDGKSIRYDVTGFEHGSENEMEGVFLNGDYFTMREDRSRIHPLAIPMQYTGIKDSKDNEWFDGDIIECVDPDDNSRAVIKQGKFGWLNCFDNVEAPLDEFTLEWFVKIGDIYTTPELLEGKEDE
jgi:hypothetical protein